MPSIEGLRLKFRNEIFIPLTKKKRNSKLKKKNFTIISNNCWGGTVYESYDLPKNSPTVGLFFFASDYIRFLENLQGYIRGELTFISLQESKWKDNIMFSNRKDECDFPIGRLSDGKDFVEIFFRHYHTEQEAKEKWERRCKRINWDCLIVKFNDQNGCTENDLRSFLNLNFKNKLFFTSKVWPGVSDNQYIKIRQFSKSHSVLASYEPFGKSKYIDLTKYINSIF